MNGVDYMRVLRTTLPQPKYGESQTRLAFYDRVLAEIAALPGVEGAAYGTTLPFQSVGNTMGFGIEGRVLDASDPRDALSRVGTPDYLRTLGVTLVEGRLLDARDGNGAPLSVVVNETMARIYWPRETALGHRLWLGDPNRPFYTIVGVVKDVHEASTPAMKPAVHMTAAPFRHLNG
jgi:hypothetical protein